VRIPGWARDEPVPGSLYRFMDRLAAQPAVRVNGGDIPMTVANGYIAINRTWQPGDVIDLNLPMTVRRVVADDRVEADRNRVALQRGPIVYAAEWPDNPNGKVRNIVLPDANPLTAEFRADLLNGVEVIKGRAVGLTFQQNGTVTKTEQPFMAIPYATWANRGRGQMTVWLARTEAAAKPTPYPTVATTSTLTHSPSRKNIRTIVDGEDPSSSDDPASYFDWWPTNGSDEWIEMAFAKPASVSEIEIYWFDDTGHGGVRVPKSWRLLYKAGDQWKSVETSDDYGIARDRYNTVRFKPVTTSALRLELTEQPRMSAGVQEWKVK
jgi:uncharacterized protein